MNDKLKALLDQMKSMCDSMGADMGKICSDYLNSDQEESIEDSGEIKEGMPTEKAPDEHKGAKIKMAILMLKNKMKGNA